MVDLIKHQAGTYSGYKSEIHIGPLIFYSQNGIYYTYEFNANDSGQPADSTVVVYNVAPDEINRLKKGQKVWAKSGIPEFEGQEAFGTLTGFSQAVDGKDRTLTVTFSDGANYAAAPKLQSTFNGAKTVKVTHKIHGKEVSYDRHIKKELNVSFPQNVKASQIISRICSSASFKLGHCKLKHDHVYKRGYTLSEKPYTALQKVVGDCQSKIYVRNDQIIIEDGSENNPFHENLYLAIGSGLLQDPQLTDGSGKAKTYTLECLDDARVTVGSAVWVDGLGDSLHRVQSVKHTKDSDGYKMEVVVYA